MTHIEVLKMVEAYCPSGELKPGEKYTIELNGMQIGQIRKAAGPREIAPTFTARNAFPNEEVA